MGRVFYPTGLFKSSFLSVAFFHAYMNSSMPPPQWYRVKGILQETSKSFFLFFLSFFLRGLDGYSRCKTTITPINPSRTFFIHGCSESMMVT